MDKTRIRPHPAPVTVHPKHPKPRDTQLPKHPRHPRLLKHPKPLLQSNMPDPSSTPLRSHPSSISHPHLFPKRLRLVTCD